MRGLNGEKSRFHLLTLPLRSRLDPLPRSLCLGFAPLTALSSQFIRIIGIRYCSGGCRSRYQIGQFMNTTAVRSATWATIELLCRFPVSYQSDEIYECGNRLWFASAKRADCPSPRTIHCCRRKTTTANLKPISEFSWRGEFETSIHFADLAPYHHCRPVTDLLLILIDKKNTNPLFHFVR
jgi:hypothetical protein